MRTVIKAALNAAQAKLLVPHRRVTIVITASSLM